MAGDWPLRLGAVWGTEAGGRPCKKGCQLAQHALEAGRPLEKAEYCPERPAFHGTDCCWR